MAEDTNPVKTAFKATIKDRLTAKPNQWAGPDSAEVVRNCVVALLGGDGNPAALTDVENDIITVCSSPTQEVQMRVIGRILADHKISPAQADMELIKNVINAAAFKLELVKAGRITDTKAGKLKDLLA